jgi:hypothetical protein
VPTARSGRLRDREDRADENMAMSSVAAPLDQTFPPDSGGGHQLRPIGDSRQTWDTGSKAAGLSVDTPASLPNGTCSRLATATGPPPHPHPPLPDSIANAGWLLWPTWEDMNAFGAPGLQHLPCHSIHRSCTWPPVSLPGAISQEGGSTRPCVLIRWGTIPCRNNSWAPDIRRGMPLGRPL